jgi:hypothetical protein
MTQETTVAIAGTCPACSKAKSLVAVIATVLETGVSSARISCKRCRATSPVAATYVAALRLWAADIAAKAAKARKSKTAKSGKLSPKSLKIRMKRIGNYARIILPALIAKETKDLSNAKTQTNLVIRTFNFARKMAQKRADVYKDVKAGNLV